MHCDKYIPIWRAVGRGLISRRFDFFSLSAAASHRPTVFSAAASHRPTAFSFDFFSFFGGSKPPPYGILG